MSGAPRGSSGVLVEQHDRLLLDLDGVCYVGDRAIPEAVEAMRAVRAAGLSVRFLTNNASRTPENVAARLAGFGIAATPEEIVTSAGCAARLLGDELPAGAAVLVVGGPGLVDAVAGVGLRPVDRAADNPVAVVQGWGPDVGWRLLAEAATAIHAGATWIATNLDATIPSERGRLPGNGALVGALGTAVEQDPRSIGKPEPAMYDAAGDDAAAPLAVGDRLDTDILGAARGSVPSLLVMTGVTRPIDLLRASPDERPTYLGPDLRSVCSVMPSVERAGDGCTCREARAMRHAATAIRVDGDRGPDGLDRLRAACALVWDLTDRHELSRERIAELDLDL